MNYKEFKAKMEVLVKFYQKQGRAESLLSEALDVDGYIRISFGDELASEYQKILGEAVGDSSDWIGYWLWECDMGKEPGGWSKKDEDALRPMKTLKNLWDAIQETKE